MSDRTALFIGRFQPFHLGHLSVIEDIASSGFNRVVIGLGSSQYSGTDQNPLTAEQREELIHASIQNTSSLNVEYAIVRIPDIHDDRMWVDHVHTTVAKSGYEFSSIYTGNHNTSTLFSSSPVEIVPVQFIIQISATEIRQMAKSQDESWKRYVHSSIIELVEKYLLLPVV